MIIIYKSSVDIDKTIQKYQGILFDKRKLFLRRTLPITQPPYERFMSSNALLVSLNLYSTSSSNDQQFNEKNIRLYFSKYGSIVSCRVVMIYTTYLIYFNETNSVDYIIFNEPHFYNNKELIIRKYISPDRIRLFLSNDGFYRNRKIKYTTFERYRRLKDIIEATKFGQDIELKLIENFYKEKMLNKNEEKHIDILQLKKQCDDLKEKNFLLKIIIEQNQRIRKYIIDLYKSKIEIQRNRMNALKCAIDLLSFH